MDRYVHITVENESGYAWKGLAVYNCEGASDNYKRLPSQVENKRTLFYGAWKPQLAVNMGACGVFTYYIGGLGKTLAVAYSAPYDRKSNSNWWNIKIYEKEVLPDYSMYKDLQYYERPFQGDSKRHRRSLSSGLKVSGVMSDSGNATLDIKVENVQQVTNK